MGVVVTVVGSLGPALVGPLLLLTASCACAVGSWGSGGVVSLVVVVVVVVVVGRRRRVWGQVAARLVGH